MNCRISTMAVNGIALVGNVRKTREMKLLREKRLIQLYLEVMIPRQTRQSVGIRDSAGGDFVPETPNVRPAASLGASSTSGIYPSYGVAVAWLRKHSEVISNFVKVIHQYPHLIREDSLNVFWNFLKKFLGKGADECNRCATREKTSKRQYESDNEFKRMSDSTANVAKPKKKQESAPQNVDLRHKTSSSTVKPTQSPHKHPTKRRLLRDQPKSASFSMSDIFSATSTERVTSAVDVSGWQNAPHTGDIRKVRSTSDIKSDRSEMSVNVQPMFRNRVNSLTGSDKAGATRHLEVLHLPPLASRTAVSLQPTGVDLSQYSRSMPPNDFPINSPNILEKPKAEAPRNEPSLDVPSPTFRETTYMVCKRRDTTSVEMVRFPPPVPDLDTAENEISWESDSDTSLYNALDVSVLNIDVTSLTSTPDSTGPFDW